MIKSRDRASRCRVRAASSGLAAHRAERDGATHHQPRPTCPQWTHGAIESNSWAPKGPPKKKITALPTCGWGLSNAGGPQKASVPVSSQLCPVSTSPCQKMRGPIIQANYL